MQVLAGPIGESWQYKVFIHGPRYLCRRGAQAGSGRRNALHVSIRRGGPRRRVCMLSIQLCVSISITPKYSTSPSYCFYLLTLAVLVRRTHWILVIVHFHSSTVYYIDSMDGILDPNDFALKMPLNT